MFLALAASITTAKPSWATTILSSPLDFATQTTLVTFETYPDGTPVPYVSGGVYDEWPGLIVSGSGAWAYSAIGSRPPYSGTRAIGPSGNIKNGTIQLLFVLPGTSTPITVPEAGLWVLNSDPTGSTVDFLDGAGGLLWRTTTTNSSTTFLGLRETSGIGSIRITDPWWVLVDDVQFTAVPEPATGFLTATGLALVALSRRLSLRRRDRLTSTGLRR
jgi:hypothetical protein